MPENKKNLKSSKNSPGLLRRADRAVLRVAGRLAAVIRGHERYRTTIPLKIGSIKGAFVEVCNLIFYYARSERSFGYTGITVEPINKCNLRCLQCSVNRGMQRPKEKVDPELFAQVLDSSPHLERVHLTGWGEPLLHKDLCRMIKLAREKGLIVTMVSNASLLDEQKAVALLDSGVSIITFSLDGVGKTYEKVRGIAYEKVKKNILRFLELRKESEEKPFVEINVVLFDETVGAEEAVRKEWEGLVDLVTAQPLVCEEENQRKKSCVHLWRRLVVQSSGRVVPCCVDAEGELNLGDAKTANPMEIFNGPAMRRLRRAHLKGRFPKLCAHCNEFYG